MNPGQKLSQKVSQKLMTVGLSLIEWRVEVMMGQSQQSQWKLSLMMNLQRQLDVSLDSVSVNCSCMGANASVC